MVILGPPFHSGSAFPLLRDLEPAWSRIFVKCALLALKPWGLVENMSFAVCCDCLFHRQPFGRAFPKRPRSCLGCLLFDPNPIRVDDRQSYRRTQLAGSSQEPCFPSSARPLNLPREILANLGRNLIFLSRSSFSPSARLFPITCRTDPFTSLHGDGLPLTSYRPSRSFKAASLPHALDFHLNFLRSARRALSRASRYVAL
jgi:hypothetical protein